MIFSPTCRNPGGNSGRATFLVLLAALALAGCGGGSSGATRRFPLPSLATTTVAAGDFSSTVWIMDTDDKRAEGLMFVAETELSGNRGMLFVFPDSQFRSFFMRNTMTPLDIVFVDENGVVLNVASGIPFSTTILPSVAPAKFVVEWKAGTAAASAIAPGTRLTFDLSLPAQ